MGAAVRPSNVPSARQEALPELLHRLFWEYDVEDLKWPRDRELILGKVLRDGGWEAVQWLRREAGDDAIREWILGRGGRGLSPPQLRFWELLLELDTELVDAWLEERDNDPWENRFHPRAR